MLSRFKQTVLCPLLPKNWMRSDMLLERLALLLLKAIYFLLQWRRVVNLVRPSFGIHEHTVQLLERRQMAPQLSAVFETDDTKTESCQQRRLLRLSEVAEVQRNSSLLGKVQRRNLSSMTKVLSLILSAAQHLDSSCTDYWNRTAHFGRLDLLEVCANSDSPLVEAVESAGGEGLRTSFSNWYDLTTRRCRERLHLFCSAKRPRHVWFSSICRISGASSQTCVSVLWRESQPWSRECKHLVLIFILCNHSAYPVGDGIRCGVCPRR